ncbi:MAG: hypothetical protein AAF199_04795, partial [Pseudomonadota bacterium]
MTEEPEQVLEHYRVTAAAWVKELRTEFKARSNYSDFAADALSTLRRRFPNCVQRLTELWARVRR